MDLNELYHRHQISVMRASSATTREARSSHNGLALGYAGRIAEHQLAAGVSTPTIVVAR